MALNHRRDDPAYDLLERKIREVTDSKSIVYARNWGNWGDALIHQGTEQFLGDRGLAHTTLSQPQIDTVLTSLNGSGMKTTGSVLLAGGSGGWCEAWSRSRSFIERIYILFDHVVVLPTTYQLSPLDVPSDRITYFRRDHFGSLVNSPGSLFCHDMAFYLDNEIARNPSDGGVGYFFRQDAERSLDARKFPGSVDLSALNYETKDVEPFFGIISAFNSIHTDRLHIAIASCLLGLPVVMYPGSYSKSFDIYRSSILGAYENVTYAEW